MSIIFNYMKHNAKKVIDYICYRVTGRPWGLNEHLLLLWLCLWRINVSSYINKVLLYTITIIYTISKRHKSDDIYPPLTGSTFRLDQWKFSAQKNKRNIKSINLKRCTAQTALMWSIQRNPQWSKIIDDVDSAFTSFSEPFYLFF